MAKVIEEYRGHRIEVERDESMGGWEITTFVVERMEDGEIIEDNYTTGTDPIQQVVEWMKLRVDDSIDSPQSKYL